MQTNKQGSAMIIIFFITTLILFVGLSVIRSYSLSNECIHQQHRYWKRYYFYEGCLEYALAYFYTDSQNHSTTLPYRFKYNEHRLHITIQDDMHTKKISIIINQGKNIVATGQIVLEKNALMWVVKSRILMIQSSVDLDKKALLPYTKLLKS